MNRCSVVHVLSLATVTILALVSVPSVFAEPAPPPVPTAAAQEGPQLIVLLREGVVPAAAMRVDLDQIPAAPIDPDLERTLLSLGVHRFERLIQRPLHLPPKVPELIPAGHEDPYDPRRLFLIRLPRSVHQQEALDRLNALPAVIYAEPDGEVKGMSAPADGELRTVGQALTLFPNDPKTSWGLDVIRAGTAWQFQTGLPSVRIAVLDTGAVSNHPELNSSVGPKLVGGYDFVHGDSNFTPDSGVRDPSHGLSVAGIAAALTHNGIASAGVCGGDNSSTQGCQVLMPKILGSRSIKEWLAFALAWLGNHHLSVDAIYWSLNRGADVLNNSWCSDRGFFTLPYTVHAAFRDAFIRGALNVAAMGNTNGDCNQNSPNEAVPPASYSDVMTSVGAVNSSRNRVVLSTWQSATGVHIDLTAPGLSVPAPEPGGSWRYFSGTSAATPFVSGAMGLVLSEIAERNLPLAHYDVPHLLRLTAADRGAPGFDTEYGAGIVDVGKALEVLQSPYVIETGTAGPASDCYSLSGTQQWVFMHDFGLYLVRRCEIRRTISFQRSYKSAPLVWGRPITTGGVTPSNPNGQVTWTGVVPGSVTTSGAQLRTYVYKRWDLLGNYLGWYPRLPSKADFAYALVGEPVTFTPKPPPDPNPDPCAGFDYTLCQPLYDCEYMCVIGSPGPIGNECCYCNCDGESACPVCLMVEF